MMDPVECDWVIARVACEDCLGKGQVFLGPPDPLTLDDCPECRGTGTQEYEGPPLR